MVDCCVSVQYLAHCVTLKPFLVVHTFTVLPFHSSTIILNIIVLRRTTENPPISVFLYIKCVNSPQLFRRFPFPSIEITSSTVSNLINPFSTTQKRIAQQNVLKFSAWEKINNKIPHLLFSPQKRNDFWILYDIFLSLN